jgi:uncharacterized membrane protein
VSDPAPIFLAASALVVLVLGSVHLAYTFFGRKLHPRDPALIAAMSAASPWISRDTTMWKAWVSFNATHSMGAMLFGLLYAWLALRQPALVFGSAFLLVLGAVFLLGYCLLGHRYWFNIPYGGSLLSLALYLAACVLAFR